MDLDTLRKLSCLLELHKPMRSPRILPQMHSTQLLLQCSSKDLSILFSPTTSELHNFAVTEVAIIASSFKRHKHGIQLPHFCYQTQNDYYPL